MVYTFIFIAYVTIVYADRVYYIIYYHKRNMNIAMLCCHGYTVIYELLELYREKKKFFMKGWNYFDMGHILGGSFNLYLQFND